METLRKDHQVSSIVREIANDYRHFDRGALAVMATEIATIPHLRRLVSNFGNKKLHPKRPTILLCRQPTTYLLGWREGEGTGVHDHGQAEVGINVICGQITEDLYATVPEENNSRRVLLAFSRQLLAGQTITCPANYIHRFRNVFPEVCATLHVYGPKLSKMSSWDDKVTSLKFVSHWEA